MGHPNIKPMRLDPDKRIVREKISVKDITCSIVPEVVKDIEHRISLYKQKGGDIDGYPMYGLMDSIRKSGWSPDCRDYTYHGEPAGYQPFCVEEMTDPKYPTKYLLHIARHRYMALRLLGLEEIDAFVVKSGTFDHVSKDELKKFIKHMKQVVGTGQQYQSLILPHGIHYKSRDESSLVFNDVFPSKYYAGKTVLDVGTHIGNFALEAKRCGAKRVVGFDLDGKLIRLGRELSSLLNLEIELHECDFWDFPLWGKEKFDLIMAHQCLYHFTTEHRCAHAKEHTEKQLLDLLCRHTKEDFTAYTFVHREGYKKTQEGYHPTESQARKDFQDRKFFVRILPPIGSGSKRTILASRRKNFYTNPEDYA